jgi:tRNA(Ile)-lysidine synthase
LASVGNPPHIKALQTLTEARRSNLLRHWLQGQGCRASTAQMLELNRLIVACTTRGHDIQLKVGESCVVRRNAVLELVEYGVLPNHRVK